MNFNNYKTDLSGKEIHEKLLKRKREYSGADILLLFYEELLGLNLQTQENPEKKAQETIANFDEQIFDKEIKSEWCLGKQNIWNRNKTRMLHQIVFHKMKNNPEALGNFGRTFPEILRQIDEKLARQNFIKLNDNRH